MPTFNNTTKGNYMTNLRFMIKKIFFFTTALCLGGCLGMPESVTPVKDFELSRYLGKWYEIARLDHSFERGMDQVTAEYSLREDGGVAVTNRGFLSAENKWKEAVGKAFFVEEPGTGYLKVSFFGPFYGSYVIFELDRENYQYAFVSGPDNSYLWLLARTPTVEKALLDRFTAQAEQLGFATEQLIYVSQKVSQKEK
jgi:apolipoprotein D and lipocalin family protein